MSFRLRLILAFGLLALVQAGLFTLLSDQLLRDGLDGEATERLALVASLFSRELGAPDWPPPKKTNEAWERRMLSTLDDYSKGYGLARATLLIDKELILDSALPSPWHAPVAERWLSDGLKPPKVSGMARISGPLFKSEEGWHKTLYLKLSRERELWLRLEAGTPFLGALAAIQKRLYRLAMALGLPSLLAGLALAWTLSRRARDLARQLEGAPKQVALSGHDEFAGLAGKIDGLIQSLARERALSERLLQARVSQARHLAFGVAHELRNPLAGLSLMTDLLKRKTAEGAPPEELKSIAGRVQAESARVENTVARFLDFARTPVLKIERVDLLAAAQSAARGLKPEPGLSGGAAVQADAKALAVILGVLLGNAAEAAGDSGQVSLSVSAGQGQAILRVWDSGPALAEEDVSRLFSPFFTTKPKGLGLGLATAAGLADAMGGRLGLAEDRKSFELVLPI